MNYCITHPEEMSKLSKLKAQITEVKGIMMDNIEKVNIFCLAQKKCMFYFHFFRIEYLNVSRSNALLLFCVTFIWSYLVIERSIQFFLHVRSCSPGSHWFGDLSSGSTIWCLVQPLVGINVINGQCISGNTLALTSISLSAFSQTINC